MEIGVFFTAGEGAVDIARVARAAAVTQRLRIGTGVCLLPLREPIALPKDIATLARIAAWGERVDPRCELRRRDPRGTG